MAMINELPIRIIRLNINIGKYSKILLATE